MLDFVAAVRFDLILMMARTALLGNRREFGLVTVLLAANHSVAMVVRSACLLAWQVKHLRS